MYRLCRVAVRGGMSIVCGSLRLCSTTMEGRNATDPLYQALGGNYVSFDACPANAQYGLHQAPRSEIGKNLRECDPSAIQVYVIPNLISSQEEVLLQRYADMQFDRLPFERAHEDALIHHYKEFYRAAGGLLGGDAREEDHGVAVGPMGALGQHMSSTTGRSTNASSTPSLYNLGTEGERLDPPAFTNNEEGSMASALRRCRAAAREYLPMIPLQERVHFIRIHGDGFIRAHVDESRNSSGIVAGLTLNTGRVMSLTHPTKFPGARIDMLLAPGSFYILTGSARYEWLHSVDWTDDDADHNTRMRAAPEGNAGGLDGEEVVFGGRPTGLKRGVRTGLIMRGVSPMELLMRRK